MIEEIERWTHKTREDSIAALVKILDEAGLPRPCDDISLGIVLLWAIDCRKRELDFEDCFDAEFENLMERLNPPAKEDDIDF